MTPTASPDGGSPGHQMRLEMAEQPERLAELLERRRSIQEELRQLVAWQPRPAGDARPEAVGTVVVARGSSDHAATCGRYLLEMATGRPSASASPSVHVVYGRRIDYSGYLVIAVSQSGRTPEIASMLRLAASTGARTVAITNDPSSPLAGEAHVVVPLGVGEEKAVPATKTVTAEILAFAIIAEAFGDLGIGESDWHNLPSQAAEVLDDGEPPAEIAAFLAETDRLAVTARGLLYGAASETALKIEETTGILASALSAAELRHGPIAVAAGGIPVLALVHPGPAVKDVLRLGADLSRLGSPVRFLGPVEGSSARWPGEAPEVLAPVLAVLRGQQLALELSLLRGSDPDSPTGLSKVTLT